jgi:pyruvate/2-oxoglutarate dehydrogenase complex dihydrolipoamide dehydrogenase (E3) component
MVETIKADICVIGAGSAGLSVAAGASQMGASVVLIEKGTMGGDCLNTGCVPSKALLAAAHAAQGFRDAGRFGIGAVEPAVDFAKVRDHVRGVIAGIAPNDSVERFEGLGVRVIQEEARFTGPREVVAGEVAVRARRFVVATGSSALVPPIPGLDRAPYFTNETIFDNATCPDHLIVIGGGPIGIEMAQAHRRLGARVSVIEKLRCLPRDDPEITAVALDRLRAEGVALLERTAVRSVEATASGVAVDTEADGRAGRVEGSLLLVAAGRAANVDGLGLDAAGIDFGPRGIAVDAGLRTTNRRVFAIGDVAGPYQFTHMAGYQAGVVIRRALFRLPAKVDYRAVPWVTYTDPEVAQVGMTEDQARAAHGDVKVLRENFADNDRARAERDTDGLIKVMTTRRGRILGASIVGAGAGDLVLPWSMMIARKMKIGAMASLIAPYPTRGEIAKRAAGAYYTPSLFGPRTRWMVRLLSKFG